MEYFVFIIGGIWFLVWLFEKVQSKSKSSYKPEPTLSAVPIQATTPKTFAVKKQIPIDDIELTDEFRNAFELMEKSKECLYLTGKAGTGKSTLLRYFRAKTKKKVVVLAPTGIAAINVNGQTIHSFFHLPPRFIQKKEVKLLGKTRTVVQKIDTVIIDEASMVRADLMDGIDYALRLNRSDKRPFGGAQVILIGDLLQLPPVVRKDMKDFFERIYNTPFFFSAKVFRETTLRTIELTHIFRQKDPTFVTLLNAIRDHVQTDQHLDTLNRRIVVEEEQGGAYITLTTKNDLAERINNERLMKIQAPLFTFTAHVSGEFEEKDYPTEFNLVLKKDAQIMMIKNDTEQKRWVNGSLGHVVELSDDRVKVKINGRIYEVLRDRWEKIQYIYDPQTDRVEPKVVGVFEQFPIRLAWAITIHKSQGQTFDDVVVDIGDGAFAHGQVYVALSRCTSLNGVRLKNKISHKDIIFDHRVKEFLMKKKSKNSDIN